VQQLDPGARSKLGCDSLEAFEQPITSYRIDARQPARHGRGHNIRIHGRRGAVHICQDGNVSNMKHVTSIYETKLQCAGITPDNGGGKGRSNNIGMDIAFIYPPVVHP
jgi:hypothetical protein